MGVLRRFATLVWAEEVDRALRPVLLVTLVGSTAGSTMWSFLAIWAVEELGAKSLLPLIFLVGALLSGASGYVGGYLSDRLGRRTVILFGQGVMVFYPLVLLAATDARLTGAIVMAFAGAFGGLGGSVAQGWSPTSSRPPSTRRPTRRCAWPRTSAW